MRHINHYSLRAALFVIFASIFAGVGLAQTSAFTFQGKLNDNGVATNGTYEIQFELFDSLAGGSQIGIAQGSQSVAVINGIFTITLDFGAGSFSGPDRFLQIRVRTSGSQQPFELLTPRQPVTSAPYAVRSLYSQNAETATTADHAAEADNAVDADNLGGIAASQYVQTNDSRLADERNPVAGSSHYIQNRQSQQPLANFNISGTGIAGTLSGNTVNATTQFNINNNRVLSSAGTDNLFVGIGVGTNNTGFSNTFAGRSAGTDNLSGNFNSFFGHFAGTNNTTGSNNTFLGRNAGTINAVGSNNTVIGASANVTLNNLSYATAIGAGSTVNESNKIVLGRNNGSDIVSVPGDLYVEGSIGISNGVFILPLDNQGAIPICAVNFPGSPSYVLSHCSSSLRYKTNVENFTPGLSLIDRLRPVTYNWKRNGIRDIGFIAEEVAEAEPLLATYNEKGQIEGVKYGQITTVLVNAVKEQQSQIEQQRKQIELLKQIVCHDHPQAEFCK